MATLLIEGPESQLKVIMKTNKLRASRHGLTFELESDGKTETADKPKESKEDKGGLFKKKK